MTNHAFTSPALPQAVATGTQPVETRSGYTSGFPPITTQETQPQYFSKLSPVVTFGNTKVTVDPASNVVIGTQTLRPNQQITCSSTVISMVSDGGAIIVGGTATQYLDPSLALGSQILSAGGPAVTAAGKTYSMLQGGSLVVVDGSTEAVSQIEKSSMMVYTIGSQTLIAGGPVITVSGSVMSLGSDGQSIFISGSVTEDVSVWLGSSGASDTLRKIGSASVSANTEPSASPSHKSFASSMYDRVETRIWSLWLAVLFTILRFGEVL
jgi:hypothetical protein